MASCKTRLLTTVFRKSLPAEHHVYIEQIKEDGNKSKSSVEFAKKLKEFS